MPPEIELQGFFQDDDEANRAKRLFQTFHDKIYLDHSISNSNALLLSVYMACNAEKGSEIDLQKSEHLFALMGRSKAQHHVYVRRCVSEDTIEKTDSRLLLSSKGLKTVKELLGGEFGTKTFIITAGQVYSGRRLLEEMLFSKLKDEVRVCDPYVDLNTIDLFRVVRNPTKVRLLTSEIPSQRQMSTELKNLMVEYPHLQIKIALQRNRLFHDRYLIFHEGAVSFGGSLKHIGRKDTIVSWLPEDIVEALSEVFELRWRDSVILDTQQA